MSHRDRQPEAELLQRPATRHGLGHVFGRITEGIVHDFFRELVASRYGRDNTSHTQKRTDLVSDVSCRIVLSKTMPVRILVLQISGRETANAAATFIVAVARLPGLLASSWSCFGIIRQPQRGQRDARKAEAEFLQRPAASDGLGQALGQFIEFVVHKAFLVLGSTNLGSIGINQPKAGFFQGK
jgi:hypothetical protein